MLMSNNCSQTSKLRLPFVALSFLLLLGQSLQALSQIRNFDAKGRQLARLTGAGDAVDAHDGEIAQFNGVYYLYGTSYDCGFEWGNKEAPFCGFKVYSSDDLVTWTDRGYLFDAQTPVWQSRCDGKTYGCFRPHVMFNKQNNNYVLWINVYDNVIGYRVFTSKYATGPFKEVAEPKLAVNGDKPAGGLNNGDHDTFVDDDGTGYLAYTDWRTKGTIVIERLSADYLTGTGECVKMVTAGSTEAPGLFKRSGRYYVTYSDPNCGYCAGTGTSYRTATHPLGPWSEGTSISSNSCGGQPSFVSTIKINAENVYLYGSDLWNNAAKNEALANFYWAPLQFNADGSIKPLECAAVYQRTKVLSHKPAVQPLSVFDQNSFLSKGAVDKKTQWAQPFAVQHNGILQKLELTTYQNHRPDKGLAVDICVVEGGQIKSSTPLFRQMISATKIGWSAKKVTLLPRLKVRKGTQYAVVLHTRAAAGYYGFLAKPADRNNRSKLMNSKDGGDTFISSGDESILFSISVNN
jgi:hypothetical protein